MHQNLGNAAPWYCAFSRGIYARRVGADRPRKSVGSETTFHDDLGRPAEIEDGVRAMLDDVWAHCEKSGTTGRTLTVKISTRISDRHAQPPAPCSCRKPWPSHLPRPVRTIFRWRKGPPAGVTLDSGPGETPDRNAPIGVNLPRPGKDYTTSRAWYSDGGSRSPFAQRCRCAARAGVGCSPPAARAC
jgi:DNA polymerase-4